MVAKIGFLRASPRIAVTWSRLMGQLILARPGATDFDDQERIVGTLDIPINVRGQAQTAELGRDLEELAIDTVFATSGSAAWQTAQLLAKHLGAKAKLLDELKNLDFGLWQGLPIEEVKRKHPKVFKQWQESPGTVCPPAGEMLAAVLNRLDKPLKKVLRRCKSHNSVLVAPAPLRQVIRCQLHNAEPADLLELETEKPWEIVVQVSE